MAVRAHLLISGVVQGVFFREETRRRAEAEGTTGWVRNRADGRVEALFEGEEAAIRRLVDWCDHGPPRARVREVAVAWEAPTGEFAGFTVLPTHRDGA
jgi:acylphosphatase